MTKPAIFYSTLRSVARTAAAAGHTQEAEAIFKRLAARIEQHLGRQSIEFAECMHELGDVCAEQKLWGAAYDNYAAALAAYRLSGSDCQAVRAMVLRSQAEVLEQLGRIADARQAHQQAASALRKRLAL